MDDFGTVVDILVVGPVFSSNGVLLESGAYGVGSGLTVDSGGSLTVSSGRIAYGIAARSGGLLDDFGAVSTVLFGSAIVESQAPWNRGRSGGAAVLGHLGEQWWHSVCQCWFLLRGTVLGAAQ